MRKRIILSAGGTGGHLFPAQAVAERLAEEADVLFVAGGLESNSFFDRNRFAYHQIHTATFSLSRPLQALRRSLTICRGTAEAVSVMRKFDADLVVGFGSFHTLPVLTAATMLRIPLILHEQNVLPGRVNRLFSGVAKQTAITFTQSADRLKGKTQIVSFPLRYRTPCDPWEYYGWTPGKKTLLVCGGSQGAQRLNQLAPHLQGYQILHIVGSHGDARATEGHYRAHGIRAIVKSFEPRLDLAMEIADLALCRGGAATLCELIAHATPAIVIPYPYARDDHQWYNAQFFAKTIGGGMAIREGDLDDKALYLAISTLDLARCRENLLAWRSKQEAEALESLVLNYL